MVGIYAKKQTFAQDMGGRRLPIRASKPLSERTEVIPSHCCFFVGRGMWEGLIMAAPPSNRATHRPATINCSAPSPISYRGKTLNFKSSLAQWPVSTRPDRGYRNIVASGMCFLNAVTRPNNQFTSIRSQKNQTI